MHQAFGAQAEWGMGTCPGPCALARPGGWGCPALGSQLPCPQKLEEQDRRALSIKEQLQREHRFLKRRLEQLSVQSLERVRTDSTGSAVSTDDSEQGGDVETACRDFGHGCRAALGGKLGGWGRPGGGPGGGWVESPQHVRGTSGPLCEVAEGTG